MRLILMDYSHDIDATEDEKYEFVLKIAKGELKFDKILIWIYSKLI